MTSVNRQRESNSIVVMSRNNNSNLEAPPHIRSVGWGLGVGGGPGSYKVEDYHQMDRTIAQNNPITNILINQSLMKQNSN
jgi:hypothetical protein